MSPYKSAKQRAYMHIHHPEIAKDWDEKYGGKVEGGGGHSPVKIQKREGRANG
jgi:hypothetical protein